MILNGTVLLLSMGRQGMLSTQLIKAAWVSLCYHSESKPHIELILTSMLFLEQGS